MNFATEDLVRILEATPNILVAWLSNLPEAWVKANNGKDTWNAYDIVGHLIHGEKTDWIPRAEVILVFRCPAKNAGSSTGDSAERAERGLWV